MGSIDDIKQQIESSESETHSKFDEKLQTVEDRGEEQFQNLVSRAESVEQKVQDVDKESKDALKEGLDATKQDIAQQAEAQTKQNEELKDQLSTLQADTSQR